MGSRLKTTSPVWFVVFGFALTVTLARWVSYVNPAFHYNIGGIHIHHYVYGIFMVMIAGYLALVLKGANATFWIALFYGSGSGFIFDEMGMWLNSSIDQSSRWDKTGLLVGILVLLLSVLLSLALKMIPDAPQIQPAVLLRGADKEDGRFRQETVETLAAQEEE